MAFEVSNVRCKHVRQAALVINVRLLLYSAAMAPYWRGTPWWWRLLAAYLLIDPSLAVGLDGYEQLADQRRAHVRYLGGGVLLWASWLAAISVGATAGVGLPAWLHLQFVIPCFWWARWSPSSPTRRCAE
jgi:predicted branched-subunit amino acid permease